MVDTVGISVITETLVAIDRWIWTTPVEWPLEGTALTLTELFALATFGGLSKRAGPPLTICELCGKGLIDPQEVETATEAYLSDAAAAPYRFSSGHVVDVGSVVTAREAVRSVLANPNLDASLRRTIVHTLLSFATPNKEY